MRSDSLLAAALRYAEAGYAVFPCVPGGKKPATVDGYEAATTDPNQISTWWQRIPNANIGLPMRPNGLVAVDPDLYKPDCGWESFVAGKPIPETWRQRSARGGLHYIFAAPSSASFPAKLAKQVDVKWDGYILVAPSRFEGGIYQAIDTSPPAPAPDWLLNSAGYSESGGASSLAWEVDAATGLVIDGRENFLTKLVFIEYAAGERDTAVIATNAWRVFLSKIDQTRPTHLTFRDAEKKAAHIIRKKPDVAKRARLIRGIEPEPAPLELPAAVASAKLAEVLDDFFGQVGWTTTPTEALAIDVSLLRPSESPPPRLLLAGAAGLGKSRAVLDYIKRWNATLRAEMGDDYIPTSVWFLCPTIKLAEELAAAYGEAGLGEGAVGLEADF